MTIKVGDKIPEGVLTVMGAEGPTGMTTADIFSGKKVVLFAVEPLHQHVLWRICQVSWLSMMKLSPRA